MWKTHRFFSPLNSDDSPTFYFGFFMLPVMLSPSTTVTLEVPQCGRLQQRWVEKKTLPKAKWVESFEKRVAF